MNHGVPPCDAVVELAGGPYEASLNIYGENETRVCTVQVDTWVYSVGAANFFVSRYDLDTWPARSTHNPYADIIELDSPEQAWELLRHFREETLTWQCGACDGWIFTRNRPRIGVLRCSTCGIGGVDFRHADRHVGPT